MSSFVPHSVLHASNRRGLIARLAAIISSLTLVFGLAACAESGENQEKAEANPGDARTIEHALGVAEIEGNPERVITLGQGSTETALALGVVPVAVESYEWGADESGYLPWVNEELEELGVTDDEKPELIAGGEELSAEKIAALEPDLILAPWSGLTQEQYDQISKIAPTVAYEEEPWVITWDEQIKTVAKALGKEDQAQGLIDGINAEFADAKEESYGDHTFSFIYNAGVGNYGIFLPTEQRVQFVSKLGLQVDPVVEEFRDSVVAGTDSATVSAENLDKLNDSDLIFTFYTDEDSRKELHADATYSSIAAIAKGAEVAPTDQSFVTGSSMINPLTVPWAIDRYKEKIDEALVKAGK
ncbi:iron-siderophore ABC transporter substrate-binding protein [Corynebacterium pseudodiphtheriticum]|uniref:iron-siderophore ABC transporter substrate-binding protein n=1 Tax=Corynebacterium TaxID=1716 RepID=UPI000363BCF7|nr:MULTISPECIES: iron-siderophore ABC transporter substrate-binding protein [Corynebacterium]MDK8614560.1 iron-siderophore ABC transporter substrate-binding protein [Corynebacterium pseudodiphtheriticum]MDK8738616.1 iron-siderophore ABC transporter substrate-binding protein [Corynebacterium pseudodiphtheriticum]MDK8745158.1 iron-siderophore ABC transporter substrate-binding protein [Corynebacterium pseudodiphtheriticum]QQU91393.1 iron-siderophore ABC transporter substrate-binding protein [Coryn